MPFSSGNTKSGKATRAQLRLLGAALSTMDDMVVITDAHPLDEPGPCVVYVNDAYIRHTGYSRAEVLGKSPRMLQGPLTDRAALDRIRDALVHCRRVREELVNYTKDGREYWVELDIAPVTDHNGDCTHFVSIQRNVSLRKQMEQHMLRAQRLESVNALADGVAHDLNNALAPILLGVGWLRREEADPDRRETLDAIEASAQRGGAMLQQLLAFTRGVDGTRIYIDVIPLLRGVAALANDTLLKAVVIELDDISALWPINGDATQLRQVLLNVCVNARDAMPKDGRVALSAANVTPAEQEALPELHPGSRYVRLSVEDEGCGMPPEVLDRVFEPFFTTKAAGSNSGVGLAAAHSIVRGHGGYMRIASTVNVGTRVDIFLPVYEKEMQTVAIAEKTDDIGERERILLVEDERPIRDLATRILERAGYTVVAVPDGAAALAAIAEHGRGIALIVTDMMMTGISGNTLIDAMHALNPFARIIAISGLYSPAEAVPATNPAVHAFLPKPFTTTTLLDAVQAALDAGAVSASPE